MSQKVTCKKCGLYGKLKIFFTCKVQECPVKLWDKHSCRDRQDIEDILDFSQINKDTLKQKINMVRIMETEDLPDDLNLIDYWDEENGALVQHEFSFL